MGQAGGITATPAHLVAASESPVELMLSLDPKSGAGAKVTFDTFGVGSVGDVKETAPGRFSAPLFPPKERYPQIVILRADVTDGAGRRNVWGAVPVHGVQSVKITTKPNAKVDIVVGAAHFPSETPADSKGQVEVNIQVAPGIDVARVRSVDRLGNKTDKPLPLDPPEFVRVRAAFAGRDATASWTDKTPAVVELFGVSRDGGPLPASATALLEVEGKQGNVDPLKLIRPGFWTSAYRAPEKIGERRAVLKARLKDRFPSRPAALEVTVLPGPPQRLLLQADKTVLRPDDPSAKITATAFDAKDNVIGPAESVTTDFGEMARGEDGFTLTVPSQFGARDKLTLTAKAGGLQKTLTVSLKTGVPSRGTIQFAETELRVGGDPLLGHVRLEDARGNPVMGASLQLAASKGRAELVREAGAGDYEVRFAAEDDASLGPTSLEVTVPDSAVRLSQPFVIVPGLKTGSKSVGLFAGGRSNLSRLHGGGATVDVGYVPLRRPLELNAALTVASFAPATIERSSVSLSASFWTLQLLFGARYHVLLGAASGVYGGLGVGVHRVGQRLSIASVSDLNPSPSSFMPIARVAAGYTYRLGPGRFAAELGYGVERFSWDPSRETDPRVRNFPEVVGNLGGVQLSVGYLFSVR